MVLDFKFQAVRATFGGVIKESFGQTVSTTRIIYRSAVDLISGKFGVNQISGPIGIVNAVSQAASVSFVSLLGIGGFITINLGLFNLLPIPALDGGRLVFLIIEAIRRKPVPAKYEGLVHAIGFGLLLVLIAIVSFSDIFKLFT